MIHAVEASPRPETADRAAECSAISSQDWGTLCICRPTSMCGAADGSRRSLPTMKAMDADQRYRAIGRQGFYRLYMAHNHHMLTYGAMMTGQRASP